MNRSRHLRIATRQSKLALWQAEFVKAELLRVHPSLTVSLVGITTDGDRWLDAPLTEVGGKGLFVGALEAALRADEADLAVHSMKDLPALLPSDTALPVVAWRQDARDAWISPSGSLESLPVNSVVGSSSLRRQAQLLALRPDLQVGPIRGNIDSRLDKLDAGRYQAIILARAGLERMGWAGRITRTLTLDQMLPAAGQGALGLQCRADDAALHKLLRPLQDPETEACVGAERKVAAALAADCSTPMAAYACAQQDGSIWLRGLLASPDGKQVLRAESRSESPSEAAERTVSALIEQGAEDILRDLRLAASG